MCSPSRVDNYARAKKNQLQAQHGARRRGKWKSAGGELLFCLLQLPGTLSYVTLLVKEQRWQTPFIPDKLIRDS
jgi:hypothetical protein